MMRALPGALAACLLAAGCAAGPQASTESASARAEPEYQTGSNLPRRNKGYNPDIRVVTPEALDRATGGTKGSGAGN